MSELIGLGGKLRSGKDTVADYLVEKHGWVKLNMSDPLNDALITMNPLVPDIEPDDEDAWALYAETDSWRWYFSPYARYVKKWGYTEAKKNPEVRRLLQALGTEVGRNMIDENVWVEIAKRRIYAHTDHGTSVAITGIRFPNEFRMIRSLGGTAMWIERPDLEASGAVTQHSSETSVTADDFDITLVNDGTLDDLYRKVEDFLNHGY